LQGWDGGGGEERGRRLGVVVSNMDVQMVKLNYEIEQILRHLRGEKVLQH